MSYTVSSDPTGSIEAYMGNDYNVLYNNTEVNTVPDLSKTDKMGMKCREIYDGNASSVSVIYPGNGVHLNGKTADIVWKPIESANYYRVIFSDNSSLSDAEEVWCMENRMRKSCDVSVSAETNYYYRVEAFHADESEPFAVSGVMSLSFNRYTQEDDVLLVSKLGTAKKSNWTATEHAGQNYPTSKPPAGDNAQIATMSDSDGGYIEFNAAGTGKAYTFSFITDQALKEWSQIEDKSGVYDENTVISASGRVRLPSEETFGSYVQIPVLNFRPADTAENQTLGAWGKSALLRIKKENGAYVLYKVMLAGQGEKAVKVGEVAANELFGKWIDFSIYVDMTSGAANCSLGKYAMQINLADDLNGVYVAQQAWNTENYLAWFDFVLGTDSESESVMDVRDVEVSRVCKN